MAFNLTNAAINEDLAEQGVWEDWLEGSQLLIASSENPRYRADLAKRARANRVKLEGEPTKDTVVLTQEVTCRSMADFILLDWRGMESNGEPVEYSKEVAYAALKSVPPLFDFVQEKAGQHGRYSTEAVSSLKEPSSGTSGTGKEKAS